MFTVHCTLNCLHVHLWFLMMVFFKERKGFLYYILLELQSFLPGVSGHSPPCNLLGHDVVTYEMQPYRKNYFQVMLVFLKYILVNCFIVSPWNVKWHIRHQQAFSTPVGPLQAVSLTPSLSLEPEVLPLQVSSRWIWNGLYSLYPLVFICEWLKGR